MAEVKDKTEEPGDDLVEEFKDEANDPEMPKVNKNEGSFYDDYKGDEDKELTDTLQSLRATFDRMVEKFDSTIQGIAILSSEIEKSQRKTLSRMSAKIEEMLRGSLRDDGEPRSSGPQMKRDYEGTNNRNTVVQDEMLESMDKMNENLSEILSLIHI